MPLTTEALPSAVSFKLLLLLLLLLLPVRLALPLLTLTALVANAKMRYPAGRWGSGRYVAVGGRVQRGTRVRRL